MGMDLAWRLHLTNGSHKCCCNPALVLERPNKMLSRQLSQHQHHSIKPSQHLVGFKSRAHCPIPLWEQPWMRSGKAIWIANQAQREEVEQENCWAGKGGNQVGSERVALHPHCPSTLSHIALRCASACPSMPRWPLMTAHVTNVDMR